NMPDILYGHLETPSPFSYNGAKGMGEGGAAPVHTVCAALQDALCSNGVLIDDSHNSGDSLFHSVERARQGQGMQRVRIEHRRAIV
ncbi:MAG: hypothetical protein ACRD37_00385, partial [Candidatus Acidiferrales bacterium]